MVLDLVNQLLHVFFKNEGINVIDADNLAKEVVAKDTPGFIKVVEYFGSEIIAEDGSIR